MAQYINTSLIADNEFWDASTWRRMCRELAGLRGLAPAVHFRNTVNDSDSSQNVDDDRIFHTHTHQKIYVWGVEMCSGGYDTLKVYWRAPSNPPDAQWTLDSGWTLIKGAGAKTNGGSGTGSGQTNPNNTANIQPGPSPFGNTGTSEATLGGTGTGLHFPRSNPLPDGSTNNVEYFYNQWLLEMKHSGAIYTMAGPSPKYDQGKAYTTLTSNFLRTFLLMKEGYWKFVLDETASPWYNQSLGLPTTNWDQDTNIDSTWFNSKGRLSPVDYATNPTLYQSLPGHVDASKNSQVASTGVRYRSRFTRSLNVRAFFPEKDLVTGSLVSRVTKTMTPNVATNDYQVDAPYTKVIGYGAEWGSSLQTSASAQWTKFIKTRNSSGQDGTTGFPHTSEISPTERFSNVEWRYTPLFKKRTINRRHLFIDGCTINGGDKFVDGYYSVQGLWEEDPIYVRPDAPSSPGTLFPSGDGQVKGWFVDFRGSVFRNCTFKNIFIGGRDESCWSGVSFINCKFINCGVNTNGDSILFSDCSFIGGYKNAAMFTPSTFHSSAFISCEFLNNDRVFIFSSSKGPISDNLWWRNIFDYYVNQNGGGGELFCTEFPNFMRFNAQTYAFDATGSSITSHIVQQHEFSRNIFINNRLHSGLGGIVSSYETFSRANLFYMNTFNDTIKIYAHTPAGLSEDKCLYESWAHNFIHKLSVSLDGKTYHHRFICNAISEPQFNSFKSIDSFYSPYVAGSGAWMNASGVEGDASAPVGQWYCVNSTAMANKAISNVITNWGNYFMDNHLGSCSIFNGYHHVYDPDFDINKCVDTYWSQNNLWKYVNVAHRNRFNIPFPGKKYGWNDGLIGRKNSDGSDWNPTNINFTGATSFSPLPFEWKIEFYDNAWRVWDESYGGPSGGFSCSQDPAHISSRNECRSIYVKNLTNNTWEKKNTGVVYSNEAVLSSRPGWSQQIFRNDVNTNGLKLNLNASVKTSFDYGANGAIFTIPNAFVWKNIVTSGGFNASIVGNPQFSGINAYAPPYATTVGGTLCPTGNGSSGTIRFNCQATGQYASVSNTNSSESSVPNYFSASIDNFITIQTWVRKFEVTQVNGFSSNLVAGQTTIDVSSTSGLAIGMTLVIQSGAGRFFNNLKTIVIQGIISSTQIDVSLPHQISGAISFYAYFNPPNMKDQMFLGKGAAADTSSWDGYSVGTNALGKLLIVTNGGSFSKQSLASSDDDILFVNKWYFITAIIKIGNTTGDIQGYINEKRVINTFHNTSPESSYNDTANNLIIGRGYRTTSTGDFYFNGYIGEVYFYDRKLTESEISTNYHATKGRYVF